MNISHIVGFSCLSLRASSFHKYILTRILFPATLTGAQMRLLNLRQSEIDYKFSIVYA